MHVRVPIDPTTVNVLTDLFLVLLQTLWQRAMMTLTAADIRRSLRLGAPLPTYEHLGTDKYFTVSFSNYERHKASLDNVDKRWFRWSILKGLTALLITAAMVVLHLVIDLGLDFATEMKVTSQPKTFSMVKLQSNPDYIDHLSNYGLIDSGGLEAVSDQCKEKQLTTRQCRQLARDSDDYTTSQLYEGVSYSKMIYTESLLEDVDVLELLVFDYKSVNMSAKDNEVDYPDCHVVEEFDIEDFQGAWKLSQPDCALYEARLKSVVIDMRARAAFQESLVEGAESAGVALKREYKSYENFKNENFTKTKYTVQPVDLPDNEQLEPERTVRRAQLVVDSGVEFVDGQQQKINITVLGSTDESRNFKPVFWESEPMEVDAEVETLEDVKALEDKGCMGPKSTHAEFPDSKMKFKGQECAHNLDRAMGKCNVVEREDINEEPFFVYFTSFTSTHQIFIPTADAEEGAESKLYSDACGDLAFDEFFGNQESNDTQSIKKYIYLGSLMETVCAVRLNEDKPAEKLCATGAEHVRWDGRNWKEITAEEAEGDEWAVEVDIDQITAVAIEITGGDSKEVTDAVENMATILSGRDYPNFKKFTAGSTSPRRIFGVSPMHDTKALLSAMVTQIGPTNRTVYVYEPVQVSVLKGEYVYTMFVMIAITLAAVVIALVREAQEAKLSRNSSLAKKRIPLSRTDWVEFVLKLLNKGSADEVAHCAIYSYEYTTRVEEPDLEEKGVREEVKTPTGKLGFFKGPEPLKEGVEYK